MVKWPLATLVVLWVAGPIDGNASAPQATSNGATSATRITAPLDVDERWVSYPNGDVDVPAFLVVPQGPGPYAAVVYVHGRWGLTESVRREIRRLASRGFAVLAPAYHLSRVIPALAWYHEPETEKDVEAGLDYLKTLKGVAADKIGVIGVSYGGYHAMLLGVRRPEVAGVVGYYAVLHNPNAPKPTQLYQFMPEVEELNRPLLLFVGEREWEMRRIQAQRVARRLRELKRPVEVVVYPGADHCFDVRHGVRTVGDDMASADAMNRTATFLTLVLGTKAFVLGREGWEVAENGHSRGGIP